MKTRIYMPCQPWVIVHEPVLVQIFAPTLMELPLRVIFMGTPEFAVPTLSEIIGQGHEVAAVYTRAPALAGRGMALRRSPVHEAALSFGLKVLHPHSLRHSDVQDEFKAFAADVGLVVAYGLILPKAILESPTLGCYNLHASLLPRWRGAAPIQRAIIAGDQTTGIMVMAMTEGLDDGPIAMRETLTIGDMNAGQLHDRLAIIGADLMGRAMGALDRGTLQISPQSTEGILYAHKIDKSEAKIDFRRSASEIDCSIRGLAPHPGAFIEVDFGHGPERVKIICARKRSQLAEPGAILAPGLFACRDGAIECLEVQRAGKAAMSITDFSRGVVWPKHLYSSHDPL